MCLYNVRIDDKVMNRVRPHFKGEDAMQLWIEQQLQKVLVDYAYHIEKQQKEKIEKEMFLQRIDDLKNHQEGLSGIAGILGNPGAEFSWEDLRNEAMTEKYGI